MMVRVWRCSSSARSARWACSSSSSRRVCSHRSAIHSPRAARVQTSPSLRSGPLPAERAAHKRAASSARTPPKSKPNCFKTTTSF
nr:MAG TPA: hypothetical protein [Caudoviricetes sp.]